MRILMQIGFNIRLISIFTSKMWEDDRIRFKFYFLWIHMLNRGSWSWVRIWTWICLLVTEDRICRAFCLQSTPSRYLPAVRVGIVHDGMQTYSKDIYVHNSRVHHLYAKNHAAWRCCIML